MKKIIALLLIVLPGFFAFALKTDSLSYYKEKVIALEKSAGENAAKINQEEKLKYEFDKKEAALKAEMEIKEKIAEAEKEKTKTIIYILTAVLVCVCVYAIYLLRKSEKPSQ